MLVTMIMMITAINQDNHEEDIRQPATMQEEEEEEERDITTGEDPNPASVNMKRYIFHSLLISIMF